jgi:hypothetical protein
MLRGPIGWLPSRDTAVAALGFVLSLIGALGGAFYLEPAQRNEDAAAQEIVLESARARMLRAATSYDNIAGHLVVSCLAFRCRATRATTSGRRLAT